MSSGIFLDIVPYSSAFGWRNDPRIYRWCRQSTTLSLTQHREYWANADLDPSVKFYGIYRTVNDGMISPVGVCGFTSINGVNRTAEFSLYIAPDQQKKGYAKEAMIELFSRGFYEMGFNKIWGETFEDNPAIGLFKKIGMKVDGTLREAYFKNGKFYDAHVISILRREWDELYLTSYMRTVLNNKHRRSLVYDQNC